jgi:Zn-dependent peptidase ImmA (M78 family)
MKPEQRHRITQDVVDWVRSNCFSANGGQPSYPIAFNTLSARIRESFRIAIHSIPHLDIARIAATVQRLGLPFESTTLDRYSALAGFLYAYHGGGIIFIEETDPEERQKFSLAHELGHFINDYYRPVYLKYENGNTIPLFQEEETVQVRQVVSARCTKRDIFGGDEPELVDVKSPDTRSLLDSLQREQKEKYKEIKANFFAAELLMPMEECRRIEHENPGADQEELTAALMKHFGVSRAAAAVRVQELHLGVVEEGLW